MNTIAKHYSASTTEELKQASSTRPMTTTPIAEVDRKPSHLEVRNLNVSAQGKQILRNVNLTLPDKSITCVIGPSGCGKTTLLRSFNRLHDEWDEIQVSGSVFVDGEDIYAPKTDIIHLRKKMGLLAQRPCPLPMSIYDNIAFGPRLYGISKKRELYEIVKKQLEAVGLWNEVKDRLKKPATTLSIGQQQRLCLARGLAVEPEIILGDEATSALDPISSKTIEELFVTLKQQYSIVLVTHTLRQARRIADYVAFMYLGELIEFAPTEQFFGNPQQELTKEYLAGSFS